MKNRIVISLILYFIWINPSYCDIYKFNDEKFENNFRDYCKNCSKELNLENEIKDFLSQEIIPVSLDECLCIAIENNFNIKTQFETYKSYEYLHKNALTKFLPEVAYSWYSIYYRGQVLVGTALVNRFNELALSSSLIVRHSLTEGGKQIFNSKEAKFKKLAQNENLKFTKEEILMYTSVYYWQLLQAKINIEIHLKNLYERTAQLNLTKNLEISGMGTKFDVIRQKNEVASAKRSLIEAMNNFRLMQAKLSNTMGIEIKTPLYPIEKEVKPNNLVDNNLELEDLYEVAYKNRKDIKAIKNEIKAAKYNKKSIYTDFSPKPRIFYQNQYQGTAKIGLGRSNVVGVYVDWALGENTGLGTITKAKAKQYEINSMEYMLQNKIREIEEELLNSYYNSKLLLQRIDITKKQVDYATESVTLAEMRLDTGEGILIDVIQAQSQKTNARIEYLQAVIEYNINQVELLFNEGIINIDRIVENYKP